MTVEELLEQIKDAPLEGDVMIWDPGYGFCDISSVEVGSEGILIR
jgi:hypothetical protein